MPFFARPDLSNEQFKQLPESQLTLSGQTQIATTSGLTLHNNSIGTPYLNVVITAEEADSHVGDVLTYDGSGKIRLIPPSGAGGDPTYFSPPYKPNASVTLCGIPNGYLLSGKTLSCILETMLVPTLPATVTPPSHVSISINPPATQYEVGCQQVVAVSSVFSQGSIAPYYGTPPAPSRPRSGLATGYNYVAYGATCPITTNNPFTLNSRTMQYGNNTISGRVSYAAGTYAVYDSTGAPTAPALNSGTTTPALNITITGIYPYFWGKSLGQPTAGQALINSGTKVVATSNNPINISFDADGHYLWFAIPTAYSTVKTVFLGSNTVTNTEAIPGSTFNAPVAVAGINSPPASINVWSNISYSFYVTKYATNTILSVGPPKTYYSLKFS